MKYEPYNEIDLSVDINYTKFEKESKSEREYNLLVINQFINNYKRDYFKKFKNINFTDVSDDVIELICCLCHNLNGVLLSRYVRSVYFYNDLLKEYNNLQEELSKYKEEK